MDNTKSETQTLIWQQDGTFSQQYLLHGGDQVIATLKLEDIFGRTASLTFSGGSFALRAEGYFGRHIRVYDASNAEAARFESNLSGGHGVLEFPDGRQFGWAKISFWMKRYAFEDKDGNQLMLFDWKSGMKSSAEVQALQSLPPSELMLLVGFGWYMILLAAIATTSAVVATSATVH